MGRKEVERRGSADSMQSHSLSSLKMPFPHHIFRRASSQEEIVWRETKGQHRAEIHTTVCIDIIYFKTWDLLYQWSTSIVSSSMCAVLECFLSLFEAAARHGKHQDVTAVLSLDLKVVRLCLSSQEHQQERCAPKKSEEIFGRKRTARGDPVNPHPARGGQDLQDLLQVSGRGQVPASSSSGKRGQPMPGQRPCSGALLGEPRLKCAARTVPEPPEQHHRNNVPSTQRQVWKCSFISTGVWSTRGVTQRH